MAPSSTAAGRRSTAVQRIGVLNGAPDERIDPWIESLQRDTGAIVAGLFIIAPTSIYAWSVATAEKAAKVFGELPDAVSPEQFLLGHVERIEKEHAFLEAPVTVNGLVLGRLCVIGHGSGADSRTHQVLRKTARALSIELSYRLALWEAESAQRLVTAHSRVHELIARAAPLEEVLTAVTTSVEGLDDSVICCIVLLDAESSTLHPGAGPSLPSEFLAAIEGVVIGPNVGTCGSAAWSGQLTISEDLATDPKWAPMRAAAIDVGLRRCWSMPIVSPNGQVLGTLAFYGAEPGLPSATQLTLLEDWARVVGIAIERHRDLEQLHYDARHDSLTGLLNRMAILEVLDEKIESAKPESQVAVLFVDLDGLKTLNDTLGHDRVDEVIREIAGRLSSTVHAHHHVGRVGGDEFLIVADDVGDQDEAASFGLALVDAVSLPLSSIDDVVITASIGITMVSDNATDAREVIRQSDSAMYDAKRSGRDRCAFFAGKRRLHIGRRLIIERELRGAEMRDEFRLVYQPIVSLEDEHVVGVEALLRWDNPRLGTVSPAEFIPIAEDTGTVVPIGAWVLRESCEAIAVVASAIGRPLELGVNVSTRQVASPGFAVSVRQVLAHSALPAELLRLEITETAFVRPNDVSSRTLRDITALGAQIVLDDFGTGFSSLSWLKDHPLGAIKIDRSFVSGLVENSADRAIVAAVITMAKAMSCTVTAEGVENEQQLEVLRSLGCERVQGFYFANAISTPALIELVATWRIRT